MLIVKILIFLAVFQCCSLDESFPKSTHAFLELYKSNLGKLGQTDAKANYPKITRENSILLNNLQYFRGKVLAENEQSNMGLKGLGIQMKTILIIIVLVVVFSCQRKESKDVPIYQIQDLVVEDIKLDSLILEKDYFSGVGFFSVGKDQLFFVDQVFSTVIAFSKDGAYEGTYLGKGDGPDEQSYIHGFLPFAYKGQHVVLDDFELVVFDENFQKGKSFPIEWNYSESYQDMLSSPKGSMLGLYEIDWKSRGNNTPFLILGEGDEALLPITMSHPTLNGYISEDYYKTVSVLGRYVFLNKKVSEGFGKRSEEYLTHRFLPNFDFSHFTERQDEILISFAIDPLIHVYGVDGVLKYKFGVKGLNINSNYPKTNTIDDALDNYKRDLEKAGFYDTVFSDKDQGLTFRTYYPDGLEKGNARLQIYRENLLIGDVKVPERFKVIGKIDDNYYADGIVDELNDRLGVYIFKLKL